MTSTASYNAAIAAAARVVCRWCAAGLPRADGRHYTSTGVSVLCRAAAVWQLEKKEK